MDPNVAAVVMAGLGFMGVCAKVLADLAKVKKQVTPSNGVPTAKMIEELKSDVRGIKTDLQYHIVVQHGRAPIKDEDPE